jgi:hypothetical protein
MEIQTNTEGSVRKIGVYLKAMEMERQNKFPFSSIRLTVSMKIK